MDLFIVRHGEAGKALATAGADSRRSLTEEGRREVQEVAKSIPALRIRFDHIISSPLSRASETAEVISKTIKAKPRVEFWDELKPEGDQRKFCARLSSLGRESSVLVVGHEPYLTTLVSLITGGGPESKIVLKKAGLLRVNVLSFAPQVKGELRWLMSPRILKKIR